MTANELADWLDECDLYYTHTKHLGIVETESKFKKSATMLRTIPTLEKEINDVQKEYIRLAGKYQEVLIKLNSDIVYEPIIEQQAQEIAMLKQIIDANNLQLNIGQLKKELALQRLSDFSQEIEDRESAIYATGYWNGIQKTKEKNETLDTRSYLIGRYDKLRELTDEEIVNLYKETEADNGGIREFARAILRKASEK